MRTREESWTSEIPGTEHACRDETIRQSTDLNLSREINPRCGCVFACRDGSGKEVFCFYPIIN